MGTPGMPSLSLGPSFAGLSLGGPTSTTETGPSPKASTSGSFTNLLGGSSSATTSSSSVASSSKDASANVDTELCIAAAGDLNVFARDAILFYKSHDASRRPPTTHMAHLDAPGATTSTTKAAPCSHVELAPALGQLPGNPDPVMEIGAHVRAARRRGVRLCGVTILCQPSNTPDTVRLNSVRVSRSALQREVAKQLNELSSPLATTTAPPLAPTASLVVVTFVVCDDVTNAAVVRRASVTSGTGHVRATAPTATPTMTTTTMTMAAGDANEEETRSESSSIGGAADATNVNANATAPTTTATTMDVDASSSSMRARSRSRTHSRVAATGQDNANPHEEEKTPDSSTSSMSTLTSSGTRVVFEVARSDLLVQEDEVVSSFLNPSAFRRHVSFGIVDEQ